MAGSRLARSPVSWGSIDELFVNLTAPDTRWRAPDGALARVSQTTVYDTCGSATPASRRRTAPSRWTCSATRCGRRRRPRLPRRRVRRPRRPPGTRQVLSKAIDNWALGVESGLIFGGVAALAVATSGDRTIYAGQFKPFIPFKERSPGMKYGGAAVVVTGALVAGLWPGSRGRRNTSSLV